MPAQTMKIDATHSTIEFAVTFAMNTVIKGRFREFSGNLTLDGDNPANSEVSVEIDAGSVDTGAEERDLQVRGEDFLDAGTHATLRFESDSIAVIDDNHWHVHGKLAMRDTTRPVTLDTRYYGTVEDAFGTQRAGFVGETNLNRSDWGMTWNLEQETGVLVSDRVRVSLFISAIPDEDEVEDDIEVNAGE